MGCGLKKKKKIFESCDSCYYISSPPVSYILFIIFINILHIYLIER